MEVDAFAGRHPVIAGFAALVVLGLVVRWWWVLLTLAVLAGIVVLVLRERQRDRAAQLELARVAALQQRAYWSALHPVDYAWLRQHP